MPRKYTRKTNRGQTPIDVLKRAAGALRQSCKLWQSAREFNVSKTTLKCFVDQMSIDVDTAKKLGYKRVSDRHIFSTKMVCRSDVKLMWIQQKSQATSV